jgi:hypothetical protein
LLGCGGPQKNEKIPTAIKTQCPRKRAFSLEQRQQFAQLCAERLQSRFLSLDKIGQYQPIKNYSGSSRSVVSTIRGE